MIKLKTAFENKKAFIAFITAGDPDLETTEKLIREMAENGVDLIEIGIPFSDPVAEGTVIQEADLRALASGTTTDKIFEMAERIRGDIKIPLVFMTYCNPVFAYGTDRFMQRCAQVGIDGIIVPDVPYEEREELLPFCRKYGIELVSLIAPTSKDRISMIASDAEGFVYIVSSLGVTGVRKEITTHIEEIVSSVREATDIPCAVGFGISTPEQAERMKSAADGVIIGSAIVRIVAEYGRDSVEPVREYVRSIARAVHN